MKAPYVPYSTAMRMVAVLMIISLVLLVGVNVFLPNPVNAWYCKYSYSNCWCTYNPILEKMECFRLVCENCLIDGRWTGDICSIGRC